MTTRQDLILIVDDHEENLLLLDRILVNQGYLVMKTMHGEKVEPLAEQYLPQLILLDIQLPGMDGYEVCRRLKANPQTAGIPVIFISALDSEDDKVKGFEAGPGGWITFPSPSRSPRRWRASTRMSPCASCRNNSGAPTGNW